ncbi:MAG: M48 family metallopeptidase [Gemmatimonadaceae bacterium]
MTTRVPLTQISSVSWEHPADRAALNTLRSIPGFDEVVKKVAGFLGERGVRLLFLGDAVRVGPTQRPDMCALYQEVLESLDWPMAGKEPPQLYVTQTPLVNASAVGFDNPFIVINSGMLLVLNREELRFILAHEVGHIMSGHTTYSTIAILLLTFGARALPVLATIALMPFQLALLEWHRKSELTADRAGILGAQDPRASMMSFLKLAGGAESGDSIDLDAYLAQAAEYEENDGWDSVFKVLNTALREHPFHTVRVGELQRWVQSGGYQEIIDGNYVRRGEEKSRPLGADVKEAGDYYAAQAKAAVDSVGEVINRAADAFRDAFRTASAAAGMGGGGPSSNGDTPGSV